MRTSVEIPDAMIKRARSIAKRRGTTLRQLILDGLRHVIDQSRIHEEYQWQDCSFGGKGLVDDLTFDDWERIRERAYEGRGG